MIIYFSDWGKKHNFHKETEMAEVLAKYMLSETRILAMRGVINRAREAADAEYQSAIDKRTRVMENLERIQAALGKRCSHSKMEPFSKHERVQLFVTCAVCGCTLDN